MVDIERVGNGGGERAGVRRARARRSTVDEAAGYEMVASARRFSRATRGAVDDKLSLSAALMRAGEIEGARRLLEELGDDLASAEAALIERVGRAKLTGDLELQQLAHRRQLRTTSITVSLVLLFVLTALLQSRPG